MIADIVSMWFQANIHAFLETDDRMGAIMKQIDDAVLELDSMDNYLTGYKMQLNVGDFELARSHWPTENDCDTAGHG